MTTPNALTLLLINEQAEEIKQATISMRKFYPGCRVEAVYSVEEALEWASKQDWRVIVVDEQFPSRSGLEMLSELRQRAPHSAIIVQAERHDTTIAAQVMQAGADFFLYKKSPMFLTELPVIAKEVLEKRELQRELETIRERHLLLVDALPDLVCECDPKGKFLAIGPAVEALLGYRPQELLGTHFSKFVHPDDQQAGRYLFCERRTGPRASRNTIIRLLGKHGGSVRVTCDTVGLYNDRKEFLGTVGIIRGYVSERFPISRAQSPAESLHASPAPAAATPSIRELSYDYLERRRASRMNVHIETALTLNASTFHAAVKNISYSGLYLVVDGTPRLSQDQCARLDFILNDAVLDLRGKIGELRYPPDREKRLGGPALGVVIIYPELGTIEGPVLASLLDELKIRPNVARLKVLLSHAAH